MNKYIAGIFLAIVLATSCSGDTAQLLSEVESYIDKDPQRALTTLESIPLSAIHSRRSKALWSLLHVMALDKTDQDPSDLSLIQPAYNYYPRTRDSYHIFETLMYRGVELIHADNLSADIVMFSEAEELLYCIDNPYQAAKLYSLKSFVYNHGKDFQESLKYSKLALEKCEEEGNPDRIRTLKLYLAQAYVNVSSFEEAEKLYNDLLEDTSINGRLRSEILGNYAHMTVCVDDPDFNKAVSLLRQALDCSGQLASIRQWGAYAYSLAAVGEIVRAENILESLRDLSQEEYLYWGSLVYSRKKDYEQAYKNLTEALVYKDSTVVEALRQSAVKAQRDYFSLKYENAEVKRQNVSLHFWIAILALVLMIGIIALIVIHVHRKMVAQKEKIREDIKALQIQIKESENKYVDAQNQLRVAYINIYRAQFEDFRVVAGKILYAEKEFKGKDDKLKYKNVYDKLREMINDIFIDKEGQNRFEQEIDRRMNNIMSLYRADFPELEEDDYRFVSFLFVRFTSEMIALLLKMPSKEAVKMRKSRLKKDLQKSASVNKNLYLDLIRYDSLDNG